MAQSQALLDGSEETHEVNLLQLGGFNRNLQVFEDCLIYEIHGATVCLDLEGNLLWDKPTWGAAINEDGTTYAVTKQGDWIELSKIDLEGNNTWSEQFEIVYETGWIEYLAASDVAITTTNEIIVLFQGNSLDHTYQLRKYAANGTLVQSWTIGSDEWPISGTMLMEVASTGLLYLSLNSYSWDVLTQGFVIGEYTLPSNLDSSDMGALYLIAASGGIGAILIVGVIVYKKKEVA